MFTNETWNQTDLPEQELGHNIRGMVQSGATAFIVTPHIIETGEAIFDLVGMKIEWVEENNK